mmetsp:Transcript_14386/g.34826  ORF Transcript_14386/g.34826 Transcript_14386/m.34826 type:complete len:517 (-) Transcript_14386:281-1831(-)
MSVTLPWLSESMISLAISAPSGTTISVPDIDRTVKPPGPCFPESLPLLSLMRMRPSSETAIRKLSLPGLYQSPRTESLSTKFIVRGALENWISSSWVASPPEVNLKDVSAEIPLSEVSSRPSRVAASGTIQSPGFSFPTPQCSRSFPGPLSPFSGMTSSFTLPSLQTDTLTEPFFRPASELYANGTEYRRPPWFLKKLSACSFSCSRAFFSPSRSRTAHSNDADRWRRMPVDSRLPSTHAASRWAAFHMRWLRSPTSTLPPCHVCVSLSCWEIVSTSTAPVKDGDRVRGGRFLPDAWGLVGTKKFPPAPPGYHASEDGSKSTKRTPIGISRVSGKNSDVSSILSSPNVSCVRIARSLYSTESLGTMPSRPAFCGVTHSSSVFIATPQCRVTSLTLPGLASTLKMHRTPPSSFTALVLNVTPVRMRNECSCRTASSPPRSARFSGSGAMGAVRPARPATGERTKAVGLTCPAEFAALAGMKVPAMIMQQNAVRASGEVFGPIDNAVAAARRSARRVM